MQNTKTKNTPSPVASDRKVSDPPPDINLIFTKYAEDDQYLTYEGFAAAVTELNGGNEVSMDAIFSIMNDKTKDVVSREDFDKFFNKLKVYDKLYQTKKNSAKTEHVREFVLVAYVIVVFALLCISLLMYLTNLDEPPDAIPSLKSLGRSGTILCGVVMAVSVSYFTCKLSIKKALVAAKDMIMEKVLMLRLRKETTEKVRYVKPVRFSPPPPTLHFSYRPAKEKELPTNLEVVTETTGPEKLALGEHLTSASDFQVHKEHLCRKTWTPGEYRYRKFLYTEADERQQLRMITTGGFNPISSQRTDTTRANTVFHKVMGPGTEVYRESQRGLPTTGYLSFNQEHHLPHAICDDSSIDLHRPEKKGRHAIGSDVADDLRMMGQTF